MKSTSVFVRLFFWQTLCHSNRLRKIWTKNALFPLASFFFFFMCLDHCSVKLLELLKVHLCLLCIIGNYEIMLENHIFFFAILHCRLQRTAVLCGIHVCINFNVSSRRIYEFAAVKLKMQNFRKRPVRSHSICSLSLSFNGTGTLFKFSTAKIRGDSKTYGIPTTCIAASTTCATNERGFVWRMPLHSIFIEFGLPKKKHFSSHAYLPVPNRMIND